MPSRLRGPFCVVLCAVSIAIAGIIFFSAPAPVIAAEGGPGAGWLQVLASAGTLGSSCPLRHTDVQASIAGFLARVTVTQTFANTFTDKIEAVYAFPLPENAAVDDMTIQVGNRTIRGKIKRRGEARAIYEDAKMNGHAAALLDQERPNVFTQAIANIMPGEQVIVTLTYLQNLEYDAGAYKFVFPMVVAPRYMPATVKDASRLAPPLAPFATRAGHDISIAVALDSVVPLLDLSSPSHEIDFERNSATSATVRLKNAAELPNKDFVLKYAVAGEQISDAVFSQAVPAGSKLGPGGYFTLILQPPARLPESDIAPKELVFVLDTSGSMTGFPIEKAKALINRALDELYPGDTFNLITFSGSTHILFPQPVFPTAENLSKARALLGSSRGSGGTEMMRAIRAALDPSDAQDHTRIVCFLTDGEVGNDLAILGEIQKHKHARVFAFGIGNSVNRFLIEGMAREGRGASEVVTLADNANAASRRLYERLRSPLLTDVSIDWNGLPVADVYPSRVPDLFSGRPLVFSGRYTAAVNGTIRIRGKRAGENFVREVPVNLSSTASKRGILPAFWARQKIDALMSQDWAGLQSGDIKPAVQEEITRIGLDYRLMTPFTSFVAVEERTVTTNGKPVRVEVPVELPEGMSRGQDSRWLDQDVAWLVTDQERKAFGYSMRFAGSATGVGSGTGGGVGGGNFAVGGPVGSKHYDRLQQFGKLSAAPPPPAAPPPASSQVVVVNGIAASVAPADAEPAQDNRPAERILLESRLSQPILDAYDCWKKSAPGCPLAREGSIEIEVWLTDHSAAVLEQLKTLGFMPAPDHPVGKTIVGRMPAGKLPELAAINAVQFVSAVRR